MSVEDPIAPFRAMISTSGSTVPQQPTWGAKQAIAEKAKFKDTFVLRSSIVGEVSADRILLEAWNKNQDEWQLSRWITFSTAQVPVILQGLVDADVRIADLSATQSDQWPELPLLVAEAPGESDTVLESVDFWKERAKVKFRKSSNAPGPRSNEWFVADGTEIFDLIRLLVEAYDALPKDLSGTADHEGDRFF